MESAPTDPDLRRNPPALSSERLAADRRAARFFRALGDATRLGILHLLRQDERTVGELVGALEVPQPKVSRHLKILRESGLVTTRKEGRLVFCGLASPKRWPAEGRACLETLLAGIALDSVPPKERDAPEVVASRTAPGVAASRPDLETHLL